MEKVIGYMSFAAFAMMMLPEASCAPSTESAATSNKKNVNITYNEGKTRPQKLSRENRALLRDASDGEISKVLALLKTPGIDVKAADEDGRTLLHWFALSSEGVDPVKTLVNYGIDVNARDKESQTPLHYAARGGVVKVVEFLANSGADIGARNKDNCTPLHMAAGNRQNDNVKFLIEHGADVNARDNESQTPLHKAAHNGCSEMMINILVGHGAEVKAKDKQGKTPQDIASERGWEDIAKILGGKTTPQPTTATTSSEVSCTQAKSAEEKLFGIMERGGDLSKIPSLLEIPGININAKNKYGRTLLHLAVAFGLSEAVKLLVEKGADINAKDKYDYTPLHRAAVFDSPDIVKFLAEKGADINAKDIYGYTPLHEAVRINRPEIVKVLLGKGADIKAKAKYGKTPRDFASARGYGEIVKIFLEFEGNSTETSNRKQEFSDEGKTTYSQKLFQENRRRQAMAKSRRL